MFCTFGLSPYGTPWCGRSARPPHSGVSCSALPPALPTRHPCGWVVGCPARGVLARLPETAAAPAGMPEGWPSDTVFKDTACVVPDQIGAGPLPHPLTPEGAGPANRADPSGRAVR